MSNSSNLITGRDLVEVQQTAVGVCVCDIVWLDFDARVYLIIVQNIETDEVLYTVTGSGDPTSREQL